MLNIVIKKHNLNNAYSKYYMCWYDRLCGPG
jgi:hypothetical protein